MGELLELFFLPPLATARMGKSDIPLDSFRWTSDSSIPGAGRTIIEPAVSLRVDPDGTPIAYMPSEIRFRDGDLLRPVAPLFELWVGLQSADGPVHQQPLTLALLRRLNISLESVQYRVTVANRKAQRRTHAPACSFVARADAAGNDHARKPLLASSPHNAADIPLVHPDRPLPLGFFQVLRPVPGFSLGADLSILRVRFTPGTGEVYGPPDAVLAMAKPLQEGRVLSPKVLQGRIYELVPPENRILSPDTPWSRYILYPPGQVDPQPCDTYDGSAMGDERSWGIVDDTCDGVIEASVVASGKRYRAVARVLVSPPDFSPDTRPFVSLADDLADRELSKTRPVGPSTIEEDEEEIVDLFRRAYETASQINLDLERWRAIGNQQGDNYPGLPQVDRRSMTTNDKSDDGKITFGDRLLTDLDDQTEAGESIADDPLPYTDVAHDVHQKLADVEALLDLIENNPDRIRQLVRPPFGRFKQLDPPPQKPDADFRDPRVARDALQDMRMPPYLRDSDQNPLSLTWRQHRLLMEVVQFLTNPAQRRPARRVRAVLRALDGHVDATGSPAAMISQSRIRPRNLTARADYQVVGNPDNTRPEDSNANCYPGLDIDLRNLDRRFFPGLVFEFVARRDSSAPYIEPFRYGALLSYPDPFGDADLQPESWADLPKQMQPIAQVLFDDLRGDKGALLAEGDWYLEWAKQSGKCITMKDGSNMPLDGLFVWRLLRGLEPGELTICLARRSGRPRQVRLKGWRRYFTDPQTGVISEAYQPGELTQSLCSPWQHDFRDCSCHYWASNRPDVVFATAARDVRVDWIRAIRSPAQSARAHSRMPRNRPYQMDHYQINSTWHSLNVVVENTEIDAVYSPSIPGPQQAPPYRSPDELGVVLRETLAPIELTLALEYLYARFSLLSPDEDAATSTDLRDHVTFARHYLLLIAVSEMQHLRWVNEMLWCLRQTGLIKDYSPVLTPSATVPCGPRRPWRRRALRPLVPQTLQDFIDAEEPSGTVNSVYARVVVTLDGGEYRNLPHLRDLASLIINQGVQHYQRLRELGRVLRPHFNTPPYPYLRKVTQGSPESAKTALELYTSISNNLNMAYSALAREAFAEGGKLIAAARAKMNDLLEEGEQLASKGIGIPFWDDPPSPDPGDSE